MRVSYLLAAAVALAAIGWIASGQIDQLKSLSSAGAPGDAPANGPVAETAMEAALPQVRVRTQTAELRAADILLRGRTEAVRSVELRAETRGTVKEIAVEKGSVVAANDVLLQLSQDDRLARLRKAKAQLEQRQIEYDAAAQLSTKGYRSDTAVAESRAQLEVAKADVAAMEIDIAYTTVRAPFDGLVDARLAEIGDFLDVGDPIATIVDLDPILVVGQISERDVGQIHVGDAGTGRTSSGVSLRGTVRYISAVADEDTRTFRVELEVPNPTRRVVQGLSAELRLPMAPIAAHRVSPAILTLADDGTLGVKTLGEDGIVKFHPVTVVEDGPDGIWLAGLPSRVTFITVGQEFVTDGQRVVGVPEAEAPTS
jgi:multidrug efflux system membrane fusion protein